MSLVASLSSEKVEVLKQAWSTCFNRIHEDTTLLTHWRTMIPSLSSKTPAETSEAIMYELFDLAAYDDMDHTMLRFLRARKYNLDESLKMLFNALLWRKQIDIRSIMDGGEEKLDQRLVNASMYFIWGMDNDGRPIVFLNVGNFIPPKSEAETEAFKKFLVYEMENARFFIGTTGVLGLADLSSFGRKNIDLDTTKIFAETFQNYYPEILGRAVVVGGGLKMALFETCWSVAKFFLDPDVRKKISFAKGKELSAFINEAFIPVSLGGKFDETKLRKSAPTSGAQTRPPMAADLPARQMTAMRTFESSAWDSSERETLKLELKKLWLEMVSSRPQNLHERLGLLKNGQVDWERAKKGTL